MPEKLLSVVIPVKNKLKMTEECIASLIANTSSIKEIIIIDDHSTDDFSKIEGVVVYKNIGLGVNSAWNYGASLAKGDYICWVSNDILFSPNWDKPLLEALDNETWLVSPYHTAGELPEDFPLGMYRKTNMGGNRTGIPMLGSCFMMKKENWEQIGPIDSRLKIWCGDNYIYESIINNFAKKVTEISTSYIHHFVSQTIDRTKIGQILIEDMRLFDIIYGEKKWGNTIK